MKKKHILLLVTILLSSILAYGNIVNISSVTQARSNVGPSDWLFFDIDETLITAPLGSELSQLIDNNLLDFFADIKRDGARCFALTARIYDKFYTQQQLEKLGIFMDKLIPSYRFSNEQPLFEIEGSIYYSGDPFAGFREGIIFSGGITPKSSALISFLRHALRIGITLPKRILFFDDLLDNLIDVKKISSILHNEFGIQEVRLFHVQKTLS